MMTMVEEIVAGNLQIGHWTWSGNFNNGCQIMTFITLSRLLRLI